MSPNESAVRPHASPLPRPPSPRFTVYQLITSELPKGEQSRRKQSDQPRKKQQIYVVCRHYIYYTYIFI